MEINSIGLAKMQNNLHLKFHSDHAAIISSEGAAVLKVSTLYAEYIAVVNELDLMFKKIEGTVKTEDITLLDQDCDKTYTAIKSMIKAAVRHFSDEAVTAGKRLTILFNSYESRGRKVKVPVTKKPYAIQTVEVRNLIQELNGAYKNDVAITRIKDLVDKLQELNNLFEETIEQRMKEELAKRTPFTRKERSKADAIYRKLIKVIEANIIIDGETAYKSYVARLNQLIGISKTTLGQNTRPRTPQDILAAKLKKEKAAALAQARAEKKALKLQADKEYIMAVAKAKADALT